MNRTFFALISSCVLTLAAVGCSSTTNENAAQPAPPVASPVAEVAAGAARTPPADVVRASAGETEARAGGSAETVVRLEIADGYHINSNPATGKYQIATELDFAANDGVTAGKPVYPAGVTKKFAFADEPLSVYERDVTIKLPLRVAASASKGARTLNANLRVQPCDDAVCYPPRTIAVAIPLTVN